MSGYSTAVRLKADCNFAIRRKSFKKDFDIVNLLRTAALLLSTKKNRTLRMLIEDLNEDAIDYPNRLMST